MFDAETSRFSLFDFLGYLIPGAVGLLVIKWVNLLWDIRFWGIRDWVALLEINLQNGDGAVLLSLWGIVMAYLLGHVIAFLSSVTVEVFSHKLYEYPSDFLLKRIADKEMKTNNSATETDEFSAPKKLTSFLYILIYIILAPISLPAFFIGRCLHFDFFYLKPLDEIYSWNINDRFLALLQKLRIDTGKGKDAIMERFGVCSKRQTYDSDFHRIAYHYEYEKTERHQNKLDSYIALYGFIRAICFLSVILFWSFFIILTKQSLWCAGALLFMSFLFCLPYILFMAFMKFYRRHTLETFMCLLVDEELAMIDIERSSEEESQAPEAPKTSPAKREKKKENKKE